MISAADIDHTGHVSNTVYLQWVQDAVVQYWQQISHPGVRDRLLRVALQHQIFYRAPLFFEDNFDPRKLVARGNDEQVSEDLTPSDVEPAKEDGQ
jgi:acyl-CoA thioesterase FadM